MGTYVPAVDYLLCHNLPAGFSQPGNGLIEKLYPSTFRGTMGNRWSKAEEALPPSALEQLTEETGFAKRHVTMLYMRFRDTNVLCFKKTPLW